MIHQITALNGWRIINTGSKADTAESSVDDSKISEPHVGGTYLSNVNITGNLNVLGVTPTN